MSTELAALALAGSADAVGEHAGAAVEHGNPLLGLFVMLAAAKLLAELFARLRQPTVVGEILAGVLIGPSVLGWVHPSPMSELMAELGVIFLLFGVGLETRPSSILRVGRTAGIVAVLGVAAPLIGGFWLLRAFSATVNESLFVGTALVATSVGITARVLGGLGCLDTVAARIILGAAVIDDILGLLVLAAVSSAASGGVRVLELVTTATLSLGFVALVAFIGAPAMLRAKPYIESLHLDHQFLTIALVLCFGLAVAASAVGVAAIIGAFLAGMALAEATEGNTAMHQQVRGMTEFLVPFFLVGIGMQLNLAVFRQPDTLWLALLLTAVAVVTKLAACGLGAAGLGLRGALQVGVGMIPRGEVGIVVAQLGLAAGVISDSLFGAVLFMAVATTLIAPPLLRPLFKPAVPASGRSAA